MALSAEEYAALADELGLAGTAAASLSTVLDQLAASERAAAAVAKIAAETGRSVSEVRAAQAAANAAAAQEERRLAAEQAAAAKAAKEAAAEAKAAEREAAREAAAAAREAAAAQREAAREAAAAQREAAAAARETAAAQREAAKAAAAEQAEAARKAKAAAAEAEAARAAATKSRADRQAASEAKAAAATEAAQQKQKDAAATAKWFSDLTASGGKSASTAADAQGELGAALTQTAASSTMAGGAAGKLQGVLARLGPYGQAAAIALGAIVLVASAVVAGLVKMTVAAIAATRAKERLIGALGALQGTGAAGGAALVSQFEELAKILPFTSAQLATWAKPLLALKATSQDVEGALKAIAASTALMGEEGGRAAQGLYEDLLKLANLRQRVVLSPDMQARLAAAGVSSKVLAKELGVTEDRLRFVAVNAKGLGDVMQRVLLRQGAGALAAMNRDLDVMKAKLQEGVGSAFAGLSDVIAPFLREVQLLAREFYRDSIGANLLSTAVRAVLEPALSLATRGVRLLHTAFLTAAIYALKLYIAARPIGDALAFLEVNARLSWIAMYLLKGTLITLGVILGIVAVAVGLFVLPWVMAALAIFGVISAVEYLVALFAGAVANFDNLKAAAFGALAGWADAAANAARNVVSSLASAIAGGAGAVADAMKRLAMSALSTFTGIFQIKSPSRVMLKHGKENIAEATAEGIDDGSGAVDRSMTTLAKPPKGRAGGRRGALGKIADSITINFYGAAADFDAFREKAEKWLEEMAGEGPDPEPA